MSSATWSPSRRAWAIHIAVLVALVVLYVAAFWSFWTGGTKGADFIGYSLASILFMGLLGGYAIVTTILTFFFRQQWWAPLVVHVVGLAGALLLVLVIFESGRRGAMERAQQRAVLEEQLAALEQAQRPGPPAETKRRGCVRPERVYVLPGWPLQAEVTLVNTCVEPAGVRGVALTGFDPAGGEAKLSHPAALLVQIGPGSAQDVSLASERAADDPQALAAWRWRAEIRILEPEPESLRFATPGAPDCVDCPALGTVDVARVAIP